MSQALSSEPLPLETGPDDVIRVRGTRVTLDTVWAVFHEGATAGQIAQQYPSLSLESHSAGRLSGEVKRKRRRDQEVK